jgi:EmrB/QacA subfamily drug resistance transporter
MLTPAASLTPVMALTRGSPATSAAVARQHQKRWKAVAVLAIAVLVTTLDSSVMTVTTPTIQRSFGASLQALEWATTIYALLFGATMILWARLGKRYGQREMFILGIVLFGVSSLLVGLSSSIGVMVAMRALQAIGAAMINPAAIALVALMFRENERPLAYGINSTSASVGVALGYLIGGASAQYVGWRWAFYVNPLLCAVALWGAYRYIEPRLTESDDGKIDIPGAALSLLGLMLLIYGLIEGQSDGWWTAREPLYFFGAPVPLPLSIAPISIILGVLFLTLFVGLELHLKSVAKTPLFDVTLFALPSVRWGGLDTLIRSIVQFALYYALTIYLQKFDGIDVLTAGLASLPIAVASMMAVPLGSKIALGLGTQRSVLIGLVIQAVGILWIWWAMFPSVTLSTLFLPTLVFGLGMGISNAQLTNVIMQDVASGRSSDAAATAATLRQIGYALGVVTAGLFLATTVNDAALEGHARLQQGTAGMETNVLVDLILVTVCIVVALFIPNRFPQRAQSRAEVK